MTAGPQSFRTSRAGYDGRTGSARQGRYAAGVIEVRLGAEDVFDVPWTEAKPANVVEDGRCCLPLAVLVQEERQMLRLGKRAKRNETTAPDRIRKWSPTLLLTGRYPGYLRRSDGMRSFLGSMAVDKERL